MGLFFFVSFVLEFVSEFSRILFMSMVRKVKGGNVFTVAFSVSLSCLLFGSYL